jgi:prepilin-type processing-associated H-X9-DG protein
MILDHIERSDLYSIVTGTTTAPSPPIYLEIYNCPSAPPDVGNAASIAYAGNCGTRPGTVKGDGVMLDAFGGVKASMDYVSSGDGSANTLLISERCGRGFGTPQPATGTSPAIITFPRWTGSTTAPTSWNVDAWTRDDDAQTPLGFVLPGLSSGTCINGADPVQYPSSRHSGGVVASFCDGHVIFLVDSVQNEVLTQLMTSKSSAVSTANSYILNEADFK